MDVERSRGAENHHPRSATASATETDHRRYVERGRYYVEWDGIWAAGVLSTNHHVQGRWYVPCHVCHTETREVRWHVAVERRQRGLEVDHDRTNRDGNSAGSQRQADPADDSRRWDIHSGDDAHNRGRRRSRRF